MPKFIITLFLTLLTGSIAAQSSTQRKCDDAVRNYLSEKFPDHTIDHIIQGKAVKDVPRELEALEELKDAAIRLNASEDITDSLRTILLTQNDSISALLNEYVESMGLMVTWQMTNIFRMKDTAGVITIIEAEFTLSEEFEVRDIRQSMTTTLTEDENEWFDFFVAKEPIFLYKDDEKQWRKNNEMYNYFVNELSSDREDKGELLHSILQVIKHIRTNRDFDTQTLLEEVVTSYMERHYGESYVPIGDFGEYYVDDGNFVIEHSFTDSPNANDGIRVRFVLDKYYIIISPDL